jgi:DnaJ-class molecular chaperone
MNAHLILAAILTLAVWTGWLYLRPFGPCPRCKGTGHIKRGPRRRPVCPQCKGRRRIQRRGSRIIHRLAFKIRHGQQTAARYQQREDKP